MRIKLIASTPKPERLIYLAARQSRYPDGIDRLPKSEISEGRVKNLIKRLLDWGHFGPFEHPHFTFIISDVSRSLTHQLVRHRMATYDQQSLRYVSKNDVSLTLPKKKNKEIEKKFNDFKKESFNLYKELIKQGIPAEDARYVLPIGTKTALVVTMNARSIMHFLKMRLDKSAQWEIRECAEEMLQIMKKQMPTTFKWFEKNWKDLKLTP